MKEKKEKKLHRQSLFRHYFTFTALIVMAAMIVLGSLIIVLTASQWWNDKTDTLNRNAQSIVNRLKNMDFRNGFDDDREMRQFIESLKIISDATTSDFFLVDINGDVIACGDAGRIHTKEDCPNHASLKIREDYLTKATSHGFTDYVTDEVFGAGKFVVAIPVVFDDVPRGALFAVEDAIKGLLPYVLSILQTAFYFFIAAMIVVFISVFLFCRGVTKPLVEMQEVTRHFAKGEFDHRAPENYKRTYLNEFARSLNHMADELAVEEEAQRSFIANVSHELKTPMTTIGGFIDGILDGTIPAEKEKEYLTTVSREVRRLSRIVVSMLNLSKIEAGEVALSPQRYDVVNQIFETLLSFEWVINEKSITIDGFENVGSVFIKADRDLLQQVIYNLLDNAVKFTPQDGTISIFAENTGKKTTVTIRNTGAGVSNEELSRIFERFYKVDKSRSFDVKGVGLGLYIVKTIINMHDGEIQARSEEGEYTEFSFELPY